MAEAIAAGIGDGVEVSILPVADGGEGTLAAAVAGAGARIETAEVTDPLGRPITADFGCLPDGTVLVEMSQASGLWRLRPGEFDPLAASTVGTGELIRAALEIGTHRIIVGAGGSATVDGGLGALSALGAVAYDLEGSRIEPSGGAMARVDRIGTDGLDERLESDTALEVACDVTVPMFGPHGAARMFGAQKGANRDDREALDAGLRHLSMVYFDTFGRELAEDPGSGAAGGLSAGLGAAFDALLLDGFDVVASIVGFDDALAGCDLVVTGEGRVDEGSRHGKVVGGVARHARARGVPVAVLAGEVALAPSELAKMGVSLAISLDDMRLDDEGDVAAMIASPSRAVELAASKLVDVLASSGLVEADSRGGNG